MVWFLLITLAPGHEAIMRGGNFLNFWKNGLPSLTFTKRPVAFIRRGSLSHPSEWLASNFFLQCNCWITQLSRKNLLIVWHILVRTTRDVWRTVCRIQTDVREKRVTFILESIQIVARMLDRKINFWSFSYGLERK